jgi:hypothetical protein
MNREELKERLSELPRRDLYEIVSSILDADDDLINDLIEDLLDDLDLEEEAG